MEKVEYVDRVNQLMDMESDMEGKFLTFWMDRQLMAIPIAHVVQIVGIQTISEIPDSVPYLKGVINLRGSIIPVIDIRLRLGKMEKSYDERTCIIIVSTHEQEIGLIVDEVDAVVAISDDHISPPPPISDAAKQSYLSGIAKLDRTVVLILNAATILASDAIPHIQ